MKRLIIYTLMLLVAGSVVAQSERDRDMETKARIESECARMAMAGDEPESPAPAAEPEDEFPPERAQQFEQFRMRKMMEMLELRKDQQVRMQQLFREHRRDMRQIEQESRRTLDKLTQLMDKRTVDEKAVEQTLAKLDSLDLQRDRMRVEFRAQADQLLTVVQRAKFRVFEQRFERQMIEKVRGMRRGPGSPHMRAPAPPPHHDDSE